MVSNRIPSQLVEHMIGDENALAAGIQDLAVKPMFWTHSSALSLSGIFATPGMSCCLKMETAGRLSACPADLSLDHCLYPGELAAFQVVEFHNFLVRPLVHEGVKYLPLVCGQPGAQNKPLSRSVAIAHHGKVLAVRICPVAKPPREHLPATDLPSRQFLCLSYQIFLGWEHFRVLT